MINVEVIGIETTKKDLDKFVLEVGAQIQKEMKVSASRVLADSQKRLQNAGKHVTGRLMSSGSVIEKPGQATVKYNAKYAYWVEHGRRAGKFPHWPSLLDWVQTKGLAGTYSIKTRRRTGSKDTKEKQDKQAAYLIGRAIAKRGIKKSPFLWPAFFKESIRFRNNLNKIIK